MHEIDRVAVAQEFDGTTVTQLVYPCGCVCNSGLPVFRSVANGIFYGWPEFFLVRGQLQRRLHDIDPHISQTVRVLGARDLRCPSSRGLRMGKWKCSNEECCCCHGGQSHSGHKCLSHVLLLLGFRCTWNQAFPEQSHDVALEEVANRAPLR